MNAFIFEDPPFPCKVLDVVLHVEGAFGTFIGLCFDAKDLRHWNLCM